MFANPLGGPISDHEIRDGLYEAMDSAGISRDRVTGKPFVWHDLRHSFGTLAVQAFALSDVKAYMGHGHQHDDGLRPPHAAAQGRPAARKKRRPPEG